MFILNTRCWMYKAVDRNKAVGCSTTLHQELPFNKKSVHDSAHDLATFFILGLNRGVALVRGG